MKLQKVNILKIVEIKELNLLILKETIKRTIIYLYNVRKENNEQYSSR